MDARLMLEARYLKSAQFGVDMPVEPILTIARIEKTSEKNDDDEDETWWVIHFREGCKPLKTINTNTKCLIACFGVDTDNWIGKRVQFFAMPGTWFGERGTAVRIKAAEMAQPVTFVMKMRGKKGKNKITYEIGVLPSSSAPARAPTAYERMWALWCEAGWKQDKAGFPELVKSSTGKGTKDVVDADVEAFASAVAARKREPGAEG